VVVFDHDGVLVDSEPLAMSTLAELITEAGAPMSQQDAFARYLGTGLNFVIEDAKDRIGIDLGDDFRDRFFENLFEKFHNELVAIPNAELALEHLHEMGVPVAIASSGTRARVDLGLSTTKLSKWFDPQQITTIEDVARGKPEPDLFLKAAERASVDPKDCLAVEDSPHGVDSAKRAGMQVIALTSAMPAEALMAADLVTSDLIEITSLIR
jgi:HAD superfamily hydrolase (TIGR01509 family)